MQKELLQCNHRRPRHDPHLACDNCYLAAGHVLCDLEVSCLHCHDLDIDKKKANLAARRKRDRRDANKSTPEKMAHSSQRSPAFKRSPPAHLPDRSPSVSHQRRSPRKIKLPALAKAVKKTLAFSSPTVTHVIDPNPPANIVGEVRELASAIVVPSDTQSTKVVDDDSCTTTHHLDPEVRVVSSRDQPAKDTSSQVGF